MSFASLLELVPKQGPIECISAGLSVTLQLCRLLYDCKDYSKRPRIIVT